MTPHALRTRSFLRSLFGIARLRSLVSHGGRCRLMEMPYRRRICAPLERFLLWLVGVFDRAEVGVSALQRK